eukprot:852558-Pleurochrysis_carterae.AAC.1
MAEPNRAPHAHAAGAHGRDARAGRRRRGVLGVLHDASQADLQRDAPPLGAADDNMTPHERNTGRPPSVNHFRPMFCLTYACHPDALQGRKLEPRADKYIHLGISPKKPGYRLEVLEGPRKGKHTTTTQVVFRETVFPLRA